MRVGAMPPTTVRNICSFIQTLVCISINSQVFFQIKPIFFKGRYLFFESVVLGYGFFHLLGCSFGKFLFLYKLPIRNLPKSILFVEIIFPSTQPPFELENVPSELENDILSPIKMILSIVFLALYEVKPFSKLVVSLVCMLILSEWIPHIYASVRDWIWLRRSRISSISARRSQFSFSSSLFVSVVSSRNLSSLMQS